jgi:uncharacterized protein (TIGR03545 family)
MKIIRLWGILVFLALIILIVAVWYLLAPSLIKGAIEESGSKSIGAKMEVADVRLALFPLGVEILGLQATDADAPMSNLVEIESIRFGLDSQALVWKKVLIEELSIEGVMLNTPRETSGKIEGLDQSTEDNEVVNESGKFELPEYSKDEVMAMVEKADLITLKKLQALEASQKTMRSYWNEALDQEQSEERLLKLQNESKRLISRAKENKLNLLTDRKAWKKLKKDIKAERAALSQLNKQLKQDKTSILNQISEVKNAPQQDIDSILTKLGLGNGVDGLSDRFLGPQFTPWVKKLLALTATMGNQPSSEQPAESEYATELGQKIDFEDQQQTPEILISKTVLSGTDKKLTIKADASNIGYYPWLVGKPAAINWQITGAGSSEGSINSEWKNESSMQTKIDARVANWPVTKMPLLQTEQGAWLINSGRLDSSVTGNFTLESINLALKLQLKQPKISSPQQLSGWQKSLFESLNQQASVDINVIATGNLADPKLSVSSSIDKLFKQAIGKQLEQKATEYKGDVEAAIRNKVGDLSGLGSELDFDSFGSQLTNKDALLEKLLGGF